MKRERIRPIPLTVPTLETMRFPDIKTIQKAHKRPIFRNSYGIAMKYLNANTEESSDSFVEELIQKKTALPGTVIGSITTASAWVAQIEHSLSVPDGFTDLSAWTGLVVAWTHYEQKAKHVLTEKGLFWLEWGYYAVHFIGRMPGSMGNQFVQTQIMDDLNRLREYRPEFAADD